MISEHDLQVGDTLGGFRIEQLLGRGGMGVVFKAHELSLNRKIALKVLASRLSESQEFLQRFRREAQVIATLRHSNIVHILSYGQDRGHHFISRAGRSGISSNLCEAESKGVVHRDLKPSNIMIDSMGKVYVTDFGVAFFEESSEKLTQTGVFLGTPEYASPEQAKGLGLDVRSDIYSLGAVLYRMLSGRAPVSGDSPLSVMVKILTEPVVPIAQVNPRIPKVLCAVVDKMMSKNPDERYQSPGALLKNIDLCLAQMRSAAPFAPAPNKKAPEDGVAPKARRGPAAVLAGVLGAAVAVFLIIWLIQGKTFVRTAPDRARDTAVEVPAVQEAKTAESKSGMAAPAAESETAPYQAGQAAVGPPAAPASQGKGAANAAPFMQQVSVKSEAAASAKAAGPAVMKPAPKPKAPAATAPPAVVVAAATPARAKRRPTPEKTAPAASKPPLELVNALPKVREADVKPEKTAPSAREPLVEPQKTARLPSDPVALVIVTGEEDVSVLLRAYLNDNLSHSGFKILIASEVPTLKERMQVGKLPVSWYDIKRSLPPGGAQILMHAEIKGSGQGDIHSLSFSLHALDIDNGASIFLSREEFVRVTDGELNWRLRGAVESATRGLESKVRRYWKNKMGKTAETAAPAPPAPVVQSAALAGTVKTAKSQETAAAAPERIAAPQKTARLPADPVALVIVTGDEQLARLARGYLHTNLRAGGLDILIPEEVPTLRERMRVGDRPISWGDIHGILPSDRVQVVTMAKITADMFGGIYWVGLSVQTLDFDTGAPISSYQDHNLKITPINLERILQQIVASETRGLKNKIRRHWEKKTSRGDGASAR